MRTMLMRSGDGSMSAIGMSTTHTYYRSIHGVPGLAVRLGRLLELWGTRAARPLDRDELRLRRQAELGARAALAERDAIIARQAYGSIR